jgi:hypothetical protein
MRDREPETMRANPISNPVNRQRFLLGGTHAAGVLLCDLHRVAPNRLLKY